MAHDDPSGTARHAHSVDAHLARFTGPQAKALQTTRERIAAALPGAVQVISYGMPTFKVDGVAVVGFDGFKGHNSLFPYSGSVVALVADARPQWAVSRGTIQFPVAQAFPAALLRRVIATRIAEINAGYPKSGGQTKEFYDNGRLKASGRMRAGQLHGAWRWWRRDGSLMRTGSFRDGARAGEWTTYDRDGRPVRTTRF
jgi:uncharacterized protein YdhG (YjbR/CyaY superfamily)